VLACVQVALGFGQVGVRRGRELGDVLDRDQVAAQLGLGLRGQVVLGGARVGRDLCRLLLFTQRVLLFLFLVGHVLLVLLLDESEEFE